MAPLITLYILGGCVAVAAVLFIVMIVITAMRPPQLPDVSMGPSPTLQRVIRALTPLPFATPASTPYAAQLVAPPSNMPPPPRPPVQRNAAPVAPAPRVAPPVVAPPTIVPAATIVPVPRLAPPVVAPPTIAPRVAPPVVAAPTVAPAARVAAPVRPSPPVAPPRPARPAVESYKPIITPLGKPRPSPQIRVNRAQPGVSLPVYPARRSRVFVRIALGLLMTSALAASVAVAAPAMLDPLCDDYEWFGAETASVLRDHARDANAAISQVIQDSEVFEPIGIWRATS